MIPSSLTGLAATTSTGLIMSTPVAAPSTANVTSSLALAATTITTQASTTTVPTQAKSPTLTYHQLEELVNKWAHELEEQERYFFDEADRIAQWDQTLLNNAEKITTLYDKVDHCKQEQSQLELEMDFIEGQQHELEGLLEPLERAANDLPPGQLHSDFEREAIFQLATNVDLELGQLLSDLREMADQLNATSSRLYDTPGSLGQPVSTDLASGNKSIDLKRAATATGDGSGAVEQVTRILNCHMHSLNWVHQNTQELMERLKVLEGS